MPKLCICQICICGRHTCPHRAGERPTIPRSDDIDPSKFESEMKQSYRCPDAVPKPKQIRPLTNLGLEKGRMQKTTTQGDDYTPKRVDRKLVKPKVIYNAPDTKMYGQTTYKKDYVPQGESLREPAKRLMDNLECPKGSRMEGRSTQNTDYVAYDAKSVDASRGKLILQRGGTLMVSDQQFKGQSEFQNAYKKPGQVERLQAMKLADNLFTEGKFEGEPSTAIDYPPKKCDPAVLCKPRKTNVQWSDQAFESNTVYKTDYELRGPTERVKPFVPMGVQIEGAKGPFAGESSYKTDFTPYAGDPRTSNMPWVPKRMYEKPSVRFAGDSTYKQDYLCPPEDLIPEKGRALQENLTVGGEPMLDITTHKTDFLAYPKHKPAQSLKKTADYAPPSTPFAGDSITRQAFKGERGEPAQPIRLETNLTAAGGTMDFATLSRLDYEPKKVDCPAAKLRLGDQDALDKYTFVQKTSMHEYYQTPRVPRKAWPTVAEEE